MGHLTDAEFRDLVLDVLDFMEDHSYPRTAVDDVRGIWQDDAGAAFCILLSDLPQRGVRLPSQLWDRVRAELDDPENYGAFAEYAPAITAFQEGPPAADAA
ncbi:hypothetical protein [Actinomyces sp. MRS3W]|uniref:hypothetical protein n=1 Tax=Actinomyces sp. MRS3W TaxID=2800796 RepID=UPI0028FD88E6|nr:hypothetical protein [Actinomyces sp. MRS3W]MDU0349240.1 hypothetical protein [Actinomyces sp. MRS3W]